MIPFNKPSLAGGEINNILQAIEYGQLAGDGPFSHSCEEIISSLTNSPTVLLTHSCTAALEMAAILLELGPGDEVIMPSFTFVSTANAVVLRGATPVFVDIRQDTLNIDEVKVREAISKKTKAIFVVHYAGVVCNMDKLSEIARDAGIALVEDAAQALNSSFNDQPAGSFGDMACFSFHETKNIISGEGGCICINNPKYKERAEIIREKGTNRKLFSRGFVDKYTWVDIGSSFLPGELIAAFLCEQLKFAEQITKVRLEYWEKYKQVTEQYAPKRFLLPHIPQQCRHNGHLFYLLMPTPLDRDSFISYMKSRKIMTPFHYVPLHTSPAGLKFGETRGTMSVTEHVSYRLVRLPLFPQLADVQDSVIDSIHGYLNG
ncbi:MAG: dTDP-4-amino-4,6-dideoxygalactose transaminase [Pseudomonadota bacterium]